MSQLTNTAAALARNSIVIKAGQSATLNVGGQFVWVEDSGGQPFTLTIGGANTMQVKEGINFPTPKSFTFLSLKNDIAGQDITVVLWTGSAGIAYYPKNITAVSKDAPTLLVATAPFNLADGASQVFNGIGPAGQQRKRIIVTNPNGNATIFLTDGTNNGVPILGNAIPYTFEVSGSVAIQNTTGSGGTINQLFVSEIFYQ